MAWANEPSITTLDEPSIITSSSSLQYVNSQLVAHGYIQHPGLSLNGLSNTDTQYLVKCLLALLNQRVEDMERADELNTKTRIMGYDNDRLKSMHQTELEIASNAQREMNLWKSRAAAAEKASQAADKRFKSLAAENQRLRTTLQSVRSGAQNEIKKIEKEKDKLLERLGKIADSRPSPQFLCTNLLAMNTPENNIGGGRGYLDIALEDAESARSGLASENDYLRKLVLDCTNMAQDVLHGVSAHGGVHDREDKPAPVTLTMLFPVAPHNAAWEIFNCILTAMKEKVESQSMSAASLKRQESDNVDIVKLKDLVDNLRSELDQARSHTSEYAVQAQSLFDRFVEDKRLVSTNKSLDASVDLMTIPARDEEQDRLQMRSKELEQDRRKLTETAIKLGKERAALEEQRLQFLEVQRGWEVQQILADLPPTPELPAPSSIRRKKVKFRKSSSPGHRKSITSANGIVARNGITKKLSITSPVHKLSKKAALRLLKRKSVTPHTLETEVITLPPPSPPPPSRETIAKMTSTENLLASCSQGTKELVLPTEFVLPPPSPQASLPALPKSTSDRYSLVPQTSLNSSIFTETVDVPLPQTNYNLPYNSTQLVAPVSSNLYKQAHPLRQTPGVGPCLPQNPTAGRMVHAYSPVKPSPLSRILMMADDSPPSTTSNDEELIGHPPPLRSMPMIKPSLDSLTEEDSGNLAGTSAGDSASGSGSGRALAFEELGVFRGIVEDTRKITPMTVDDLRAEPPFREKNTRRSPSPKKPPPIKRPATSFATKPKLKSDVQTRASLVAKDKGKGKEVEVKATTSRTRTAAAAGLDKENSAAKRLKPSPPDTTSSTVGSKKRAGSASNSRKVPLPPAPSTRVRPSASRTSKNKAGPPRRVPIGSSEAAPRP